MHWARGIAVHIANEVTDEQPAPVALLRQEKKPLSIEYETG